jgi:SAM-dependent methyltransferase
VSRAREVTSEAARRPPAARWRDADAGRRYAEERWRDPRRAARDPRLVERLLLRAGVRDAAVLDAPCGTGRLRPGLERRARLLVGLDVSAAMLDTARGAAPGLRLVRGDLLRLPFGDGAFDAVVCCRLLHHLAEPAALDAAARELVRVARGAVVASFWDRAALPALGRRLSGRPRGGRVAHGKRDLAAAFARAGAEVTAFAHSCRFLSQQTFLLAEKRP